jgi:hypothetical protein
MLLAKDMVKVLFKLELRISGMARDRDGLSLAGSGVFFDEMLYLVIFYVVIPPWTSVSIDFSGLL